MTLNRPSNRVIPILLENGSKDFWHEVRRWYMKKIDQDGFFQIILVFWILGPTTHLGTEKLKFLKHRHVTSHWNRLVSRITLKMVHFVWLISNFSFESIFCSIHGEEITDFSVLKQKLAKLWCNSWKSWNGWKGWKFMHYQSFCSVWLEFGTIFCPFPFSDLRMFHFPKSCSDHSTWVDDRLFSNGLQWFLGVLSSPVWWNVGTLVAGKAGKTYLFSRK